MGDNVCAVAGLMDSVSADDKDDVGFLVLNVGHGGGGGACVSANTSQ